MGKALRNNNTDPENNEEINQYERKLVQVSISALPYKCGILSLIN